MAGAGGMEGPVPRMWQKLPYVTLITISQNVKCLHSALKSQYNTIYLYTTAPTKLVMFYKPHTFRIVVIKNHDDNINLSVVYMLFSDGVKVITSSMIDFELTV